MSQQILIFALFLVSVAYTSEYSEDKLKRKREMNTVTKTMSLPSTEKFLQLPNPIWTSIVPKYLDIMDTIHFYCINKKYYGLYKEQFQAWFTSKGNTETLQNFLGRVNPHVHFYAFPQCEFIVKFPSANCYPNTDTSSDEVWKFEFTINRFFKHDPYTVPRLILEEDNAESEDQNNEQPLREEELMTITISSTGIVTYKFKYLAMEYIKNHGLKLHWKGEKRKYEYSDRADFKFGSPEGATIIKVDSFGSQYKFPNSVQIEFLDCPFYKQ